MSTWEWFHTPWFWIPALGIILAFIFVWWNERNERNHYCHECLSGKRAVRNPMQYYLTNKLYTVEPCQNEWHDKGRKKK